MMPMGIYRFYRLIETIEIGGRSAKRNQDIHICAAVPERLVGPDIELSADNKLDRRGKRELEPRIHKQVGKPNERSE
ncbi:hypothetical protein D1872_310500 [compost metagenome]